MCISGKFPGDTEVAGPGTTLGESPELQSGTKLSRGCMENSGMSHFPRRVDLVFLFSGFAALAAGHSPAAPEL